jgi:hypothetical protein
MLETHREDDDDTDIEARKILLKLKAAIRGQQHVEPILSTNEQFTVRETRPILLLDGANGEVTQVAA